MTPWPPLDSRRGPHRLLGLTALAPCLAGLLACAPSATPRPDPQFDLEALRAARVWTAGIVETGGLWARRRDVLYTSIDGGTTFEQWPEPIPLREGVLGSGVVVWERDVAWVVQTADSVARTVDGGRTWLSSKLPGSCMEWTGLAFATPDHGYVVCLINGPADFVAETTDGGATWSVANASVTTSSGWFGTRIVAAGDRGLWAAALDQDTGTQPFLAGSHDAGGTWGEVAFPGIGPTYHGGGSILPIGPPVIDGDRLAFATRGGVAGASTLRVWTSADSGRTWSAVAHLDAVPSDHLAFINPEHWVTWARETDALLVTVDAGRSWEQLGPGGLPRGDVYGFAFSSPDVGMILMGTDEDLGGGVSVVLFVTSDGGRTWRLAELEGP